MNLFETIMTQATETPQTLPIVLSGVVGALLTFLGIYIKEKYQSKTTIKVAEIEQEGQRVEKLQEELETCYKSIKEIEYKLTEERQKNAENERVIMEYKNLLKHFKVLVGILYKQLPESIKNNPSNSAVIEQIKETLSNNDFLIK